ncbi:hypothetical protein [Parasphingorhabdus sp.]|uniref:hypothetical protein n=1 Tax=Parasphingorhabdus sp. TaxID=2709688 RepID=UPI002B2765B6|nr:hypothetical protein [Parasphingorhabdus sp.]
MTNILRAGFFYFLGVFTMGFILGALRQFFLVPYTGPVIAVLIELPLILVFAWYLCRWLTSRLRISPDHYGRLVMGLVAFSCLIIGELLISVLLQAGGLADFFLTFDLPENRIGLGGQIAFALFPLIQGYAETSARR